MTFSHQIINGVILIIFAQKFECETYLVILKHCDLSGYIWQSASKVHSDPIKAKALLYAFVERFYLARICLHNKCTINTLLCILQLPRNAMPVSSPVSVTNSTTPIVFPATLDVIKNKIVMMAQTKKAAVSILHFSLL